MEHTQKYKDAFEKIKKIAPSDSNLDKIVADFIKVESLRSQVGKNCCHLFGLIRVFRWRTRTLHFSTM